MEHRLTSCQRAQLWIRLGIRGLLTLGVLLCLVWLVPPLWSLFMPFIFALIVAWLLHPPVRWLQKKLNISRKALSMLLILLVYVGIGAILYGLAYAAFAQIRSLVENWSQIRTQAIASLEAVSAYLSNLVDLLPNSVATDLEDLAGNFLDWFQSVLPAALDTTLDGGMSMVSQIPSFAVAAVGFMMASYFITADYPRLRFLATDRLPESVREFGGNFKRIFVEAFGGYLKSQLILSLGVFFILTAGFFLIRQPYGLLLAFLFAVLDFIPIIGAGTVMVPWAAVCLVVSDYRTAIELMVIWGIICLFRRLAEPKILGDQTGLSPILSLVGIYVGMRLGGVLGMILGPLLLLVVINLWKLGTFDSVVYDLKLAVGDISALLASGRSQEP